MCASYLVQISYCSSLDFPKLQDKNMMAHCNAACLDGLITGWYFSCYLCASHDWQLAGWGVRKTLKSVMKQQSNKVKEQSRGFVMTVMDYQVFAVFNTLEVSYYSDKECRKWQPWREETAQVEWSWGCHGSDTNWNICYHAVVQYSPDHSARFNFTVQVLLSSFLAVCQLCWCNESNVKLV